ncbi:DUF3375 domain-containing protein [Streptomyces sp. NBC_00233]|uniref:DUF3375 domain-containing protein n=1 Tax=Streptomyces sp. NBC_00233 TaxID=2975686 RepID=UPI00225256DE|nr:DUF3375 domain-containing protein [Streptomyces sp. NBC_00233]MCX5232996.1 DUF3375 domain-containing protein [Streptomyces sp. NBC_00233]
MQFDQVTALTSHPAWVLLRADNAALVLSFCGTVFVEENARGVPESVLESRLEDQLYTLNEHEPGTFPRAAGAYLAEWTKSGWLRKYYPPGNDEAHFDATTALEKAVAWVRDLPARSFIGTESRLNTIVTLLRQMTFGAQTDPQTRIDELSRERDALDAQIARLLTGEVELLSPIALRDRYQQVEATAVELLRDFREVEANLRELEGRLRRQVAAAEGGKGEQLAAFLLERDEIAQSDQGQSFQAFFDYLLSPRRQQELRELLEQVTQLPQLEGRTDRTLLKIPFAWLEAAENTQDTVRQLTEQLRRFLSGRSRTEDQRVLALVRSVQRHVTALGGMAEMPGMELEMPQAAIALPMERRLYMPVERVELDTAAHEPPDDGDADLTELFAGIHIDTEMLAGHVLDAVAASPTGQAALTTVIDEHPLTLGLAELLGYFRIQHPDLDVNVDPEHTDVLVYPRVGTPGHTQAEVPHVTFVRNEGGAAAGEAGPR